MPKEIAIQIQGKERTVSELLKAKKYSIDYYQREYRWETKHISELIEDLANKFFSYYDKKHTLPQVGNYGNYFLGSIVISHKEGENFIVDGQQRLLAARRRGDIREVPCVLFKSDGREHEARAFIALNIRRVKVPSVAKFNASVRAALNPEKQIAEWLGTLGLSVMDDGKSMNGVCFPAHLIRTWNMNAECCKRAVKIQRDVNGTEPLHSACHNGIFWLLTNGINVEEHTDKLRCLGGRSAMLRSIKTVEIETNTKANMRIAGIGVLRQINYKRRRNKIAVPEGA